MRNVTITATTQSLQKTTIDSAPSSIQQCRWKLPHAKAERLLGYRPPVAFADGLRRSLAWLDFIG